MKKHETKTQDATRGGEMESGLNGACSTFTIRNASILAFTALLLGAVLFAVYWPGLYGQFFFDDFTNILAVSGLRLETFSFESLRAVIESGHTGPSGRPVAQLSFALNHYFTGLHPFAFKLTNLVIHAANGVLVFILALRLFVSIKPLPGRRHALISAGLLAALWLLHPIQLLPVLHVVQRMTSLSAFFLLAALLCHLRGRESGAGSSVVWLSLGWGIFWPLSFLSKETGLLFPLFVLAWELIVRRVACGGLDRFARSFAILAGFGLVLGIAYLLSPLGDWLWAGYSFRSFTLAERVLTEGRVIWLYLGLILYPRLEAFGLYHDDVLISTGILAPWTTLTSLVGLLGLLLLVWKTTWRLPLVSFGVAWFLIGHGMESTVLPLEIAHEHRNYLPLFGIFLAIVSVLVRALENAGPEKTLGIMVMFAMLSYFPFVTALRADQFGDEGIRTQIEAQHHRGSAHAQYDAGRTLAAQAQAKSASSVAYSLAKVHYELAGQLNPSYKLNFLGLISLNCQAKIPVDPTWVAELSHRLRNTPFAPGDRNVLFSLVEMTVGGSLCLGRPEIDSLFAAAIANPGVSPGVRAVLHSWHADYLWVHEMDLAAAFAALGKSLTLDPSSSNNRLKLVKLKFIAGEREKARELLLELRGERLSVDERKTFEELLSRLSMPEGNLAPERLEQ